MKKENKEITHKDLKKEWESYKGKIRLEKKTPVLIKLSMSNFKNYTKALNKPIDIVFEEAMYNTMRELCTTIQGCVFAYYTRNEIEFIVADYHKANSDAWLDYDREKMVSAVVSKATAIFPKHFEEAKERFYNTYDGNNKHRMYAVYNRMLEDTAMFTARTFNVPKNRVVDMIYYRQRESVRNALQLYGKTYMDRKTIVGKTMVEIKEALRSLDIDMDTVPSAYKIGISCNKGTNPFTTDKKWTLDKEMPMLDSKNRFYLEEIMETIVHPEENMNV